MVIDGVVIFNIIIGVIMMLLGHFIRSGSQKADRERQSAQIIASKVQALEIKSVDDGRVRSIVSEMLTDIKTGQTEIRGDLKGLASEIHDLSQMIMNHNLNDR